MNKNTTKIQSPCAIVHDGQMIQQQHIDAMLNLDRITDLEMLQDLTDDCLTIASCEEAIGLINPSFFKNMRWIVTYLRDLKQEPIKPMPTDSSIDELKAELAELQSKAQADGQ